MERPRKRPEDYYEKKRGWDRARRERLIAAAICIECALLPSREGQRKCEPCAAKARARAGAAWRRDDRMRQRNRERYHGDPQYRAKRLAVAAQWRADNAEVLRESQRLANARRYARNRAIIDAAKSKPCVDCQQTFPPYVMDLDHVRGEKVMAVALMRTMNPDLLMAEIAKCEAVCSNCHRYRTFRRRRGVAA